MKGVSQVSCEHATELGRLVTSCQWQLAVAESLTGGLLSAAVAQGEDARRWFKGGVVAFSSRAVKEGLLKVSEGPLVSERCVRQMAAGVAELFGAQVGLAITGVGGPDPDEGHEPGTVWVAVRTPLGTRSERFDLRGSSPDEICSSSCIEAVELARSTLLECSSHTRRASPATGFPDEN